jgi:hypothetical protein
VTAREWAVVEFDADRQVIHTAGPFDEVQARDRFRYVTRDRSQRSDVVLRSRSAALLCRGQIVEAANIRRSRRTPLIGNRRLHHLEVDVREQIIGLELLATRLALASLRSNGDYRIGPGWWIVRGVACEVWRLVRGHSTIKAYGETNVWWLQEWTCRCTQVEHSRTALPDCCPYHDEPALRTAEFVEQW